jgi:hypothetical protein
MRHIKQQETVVLEMESYTEKTPVSFGIFIDYHRYYLSNTLTPRQMLTKALKACKQEKKHIWIQHALNKSYHWIKSKSLKLASYEQKGLKITPKY